MPLQLIQAPASEPITVVDAKKHLRVDVTDDDDLIQALISAARDYAELYTRRSLMTQKWSLVLDGFPGPSLMGVPYGVSYSVPGHAVLLEKPPIQSLDSVTYLDTSATQQTMPPANYVVDLSSEPARVTPVFGQIWPINQPQIGSVKFNFTAGYADAKSVPPGLIAWMKLRLAALYENREECVVGSRIVVAELPYVDGLLDRYIVRYF